MHDFGIIAGTCAVTLLFVWFIRFISRSGNKTWMDIRIERKPLRTVVTASTHNRKEIVTLVPIYTSSGDRVEDDIYVGGKPDPSIRWVWLEGKGPHTCYKDRWLAERGFSDPSLIVPSLSTAR